MFILWFLAAGLVFGLGILLVVMAAGGKSKAKREARMMIQSGMPDKKKAKRTLKVLSQCKDNEGRRLYSKLADLAD